MPLGARSAEAPSATALSFPSVPLSVDFSTWVGAARAQVVRGLQSGAPGIAVERVELLTAGLRNIEVERLRLVDPFLPARRCLNQPGWLDLERGRIELLQIVGNAVDGAERAIEILQVARPSPHPKVRAASGRGQRSVHNREIAGHVRLHEKFW